MRRGLPSLDERQVARMPSDLIRTAVIGVGYLGRHHARLLSTIDGSRLTAVVDTVPERAAEAATRRAPARSRIFVSCWVKSTP